MASPVEYELMNWRIYYADGSTFSGDAADAPGLGVIVIALKHPDPEIGAYIQHQADYYIWLGDRWLACDLFRLWQYLFIEKLDHPKHALAGQTIDNDHYMQILRAAKQDKDFFQ